MPTLQENLIKHFKLPNANFLHRNLCGWIGFDINCNDHLRSITLYQDGSIRVGNKAYLSDYSMRDFLMEMEKNHNTLYKELKDISSDLHSLKERLEKASNRVDGNGWSCHYPEMIKKMLEGYSHTITGVYEGVNAIANHTPSYGLGVD